MATEKILVTVKTYPTLSNKYDELVCTAGVREDGSWIRIYPIPFRKLDYDKQYPKFTWIETEVIKNSSDPRPESYKLKDYNKISIINQIPPDGNCWRERRKYVLKNVYTSMSVLIENAKSNTMSLASFKPKKLCNFVWVEQKDRNWNKDKLDTIHAKAQQTDLFCKAENPFEVVDKLPYKFYYIFTDESDKESRMMVEDWEIGALYWNLIKKDKATEIEACEKIKQKYWDNFRKKDIHFFLGTTRQFHSWAINPFIIIGVFPPDYQHPNLFD